MVFYDGSTDYLLLALVVARRLARLGVKHPLILLPTKDVPDSFREALEKAGCLVQKPVEYLLMHSALLQSPQGRHCKVLTKLLCLGLKISKLRKLLLIDADILPRQSLDSLFMYTAPAAKLMQANLDYRLGCCPLREGEQVPACWLDVNEDGIGARFNAGVMLLEPDPDLLDHLVKEAHPDRIICQSVGTMAPSEDTQEQQWVLVQDIFGKPWNPSWTPEEDLLTRAMKKLRPLRTWTNIGARNNFEVNSDYLERPMATEHGDFCCDAFHKISVLHFSGSWKPTWWAWFVARGEMTVEQVEEELQKQHKMVDPKGIIAQATAEWLRAFEDLVQFARREWCLDILNLVGWSIRDQASAADRLHQRKKAGKKAVCTFFRSEELQPCKRARLNMPTCTTLL